VTLLGSMFAGAEPQDAKSIASARPRIDADPATGRLFVRAKASQIEQIERVLEQLGEPGPASGTLLRLLPYRGDRGRRVLEAAERFWPDSESLMIFPAHDAANQPQELEVTPEREQQDEISSPQSSTGAAHRPQSSRPQADNTKIRKQIRAQLTPRGILIHASNADELDRFEQHVRMVAGAGNSSDTRLAVFYLKHSTAKEADRLLRQWLDVESAATSTLGNSAGADRHGPATAWLLGSATIFADTRLNRLFVHGREDELAKVEEHLKIIDRENSMTQLSTHGTPRVIQLHHANALDVVSVVRDAYAGRITASADERKPPAQANQPPQPATPNPKTDQPAAQPVIIVSPIDSAAQPRMTLATDLTSNSLIITAPSQLADEVERLVRDIDRQSAVSVRVVSLKNTAADKVYTALTDILADRAQRESSAKNRN
jgi:type II secretory pathway component GspD/PulD (secretin)